MVFPSVSSLFTGDLAIPGQVLMHKSLLSLWKPGRVFGQGRSVRASPRTLQTTGCLASLRGLLRSEIRVLLGLHAYHPQTQDFMFSDKYLSVGIMMRHSFI